MQRIWIYLFLLLSLSSNAQNLVPNWSFEDTMSCPTTANQIDKAVGWHASKGSPDYFNGCDFTIGTTSVPYNFAGFQYAHSGVAYCGFFSFSKVAINDREFFSTQLLSPLTVSKKYKVSFYLSWSAGSSSLIASNKIGCFFSTQNYTIGNPASITNTCQVYSDSIIIDSLNWVNIQGGFIADSNYSYLSIGNFFDDINTDTLIFGNTSYAYYFIDDISVLEDTTTSIVDEYIGIEVTLFPNPTNDYVQINSKEILEEMALFSMNGIEILNRKMIESNTARLNVAEIKQGMYTLRIKTIQNKIKFLKLLKI